MDILEIVEDDGVLEVIEFIEFGLPREVYVRKFYFETLDEVAFRRRFRLTRQCAQNLLMLIDNRLEYPYDTNESVSPMNQLLVCLRLYSTGGHLQSIADYCGMHLSTVSRIVKRVSEAIAELYPRYISIPENIDAVRKSQQVFFNIASFPRVIGALDCTHIKIISPGGDDAEVYRNRKQYFSINTQAICNADLKLLNVVARWPGSVHDSTIFTHSNISTDFENNIHPNSIILGDSGYPNKTYLLTPLLQPVTPAEQLYNESHIRTRNCIERCFGLLKRRFPILAYGCRLKLNTVLTIIIATSVLHNIALEMGDNVAPPVPEELNEHAMEQLIRNGQIPNVINAHEDDTTRQQLIANWFGRL